MLAPIQTKNSCETAQTDSVKAAEPKRALPDNRLMAVAQRELFEMMNNSERVLQQRARSDAIHNSPRMMAQGLEIKALYGEASEPQTEGAISTETRPPGRSGTDAPVQREARTNSTGLPDQLKSGIESLSGMDMSHVKVHYNSNEPAQLQAHAYARGNEIHVAPGQVQHLPHEAWHVVQQAQGRVPATAQLKTGVPLNDDVGLESEADAMGARAMAERPAVRNTSPRHIESLAVLPASVPAQRWQDDSGVVQRMTLLPFNQVDNQLLKFVNEHSAGMAGETARGTPGRRVGVGEKLVLVGHGNTVTLSAYEAGDVEHFTPDTLATFLLDHVLPDNYVGEMVIWSCNSATASKHHQDAANFFAQSNQPQELDRSFIQRLEQALLGKNRGYAPTIRGAIGFVTLDRKWSSASVYANEADKFIGKTKTGSDGFISTEEQVDDQWYRSDSDSEGSNYGSGSDSDDGSYRSGDSDDGEEQERSSESDHVDAMQVEQAQIQVQAPQIQVQQAPMRPLSALYPGYVQAVMGDEAGQRMLRKLGNVMIPADTPIARMASVAMAIKASDDLLRFEQAQRL